MTPYQISAGVRLDDNLGIRVMSQDTVLTVASTVDYCSCNEGESCDNRPPQVVIRDD